MLVEIWSDVVCPWCTIGARRFDRALADFDRADEVEVVWRPFQLDPTAPPGTSTPVREVYARKFGGADQAARIIDHVTGIAADEGLDLRLDRALRANTLDAHRLLWLAGEHDATTRPRGRRQSALNELLFQAYFRDGAALGDHDVLVDRAARAGLDPDEVERALASDVGLDEVRREMARAAALGITAVPTFVFEERWAVPGAQDPDVFRAVLARAADRLTPR